MILETWAARHNIPPMALIELRMLLIGAYDTPAQIKGDSEAAVQSVVRFEASRQGCRLWRNNVGAGKLEDGSFVRWGIANDSKTINDKVKSADLIGIRPIRITEAHVGTIIGQFLSRECKHPGWKFSGNARDTAQLKWAQIVTGLGGDAKFTTGAL